MNSTLAPALRNAAIVRPIGIVAYDGAELLDLTASIDVFATANIGLHRLGAADGSVYPLRVLAKNAGPVVTASGLRVYADAAYTDTTETFDTLIVPGAPNLDAALSDPALVEWIRTVSNRVRRLVSICTGAFVLAEAGVLDGRRATTHWAYCDRLAADYPAVKVEPDCIFLREGHVATSGGITSGIDLALSLVEEDWGPVVALTVARYLVVFLKRPGGQSQFSGFLVSETTNHPALRELQRWIMEHPGENLRIEILAERVGMSPRHFARVFQSETGMTPAKFVEKARLDAARHFLGTTDHRVDTVATVSGFGDAERMRRAFLRNLGINAQQYRARFNQQESAFAPGLKNLEPPVAPMTLDEIAEHWRQHLRGLEIAGS